MATLDFLAERKQALIKHLGQHSSAEIRFDDTSRQLYSTDASHYRIMPMGVVLPRTERDLITTVQVAAEIGIPITARGGGTSLTGQSIGPGIVIDCSKYLNSVSEIDVVNRTVAVQPGVVLDQLNRAVGKHDLIFGPDVATASRATLGGMIGNNSAGARSVMYRQTVDHVLSLKTILANGDVVRFGKVNEREARDKRELTTREGELYRQLHGLVHFNEDEIEERFPKIMRKVSGYNLQALTGNPSLVPMIVGSEGTLAVIAEAELQLMPRPKYRGILVPHFDSLIAALDILAICLEFQPSAVELLDQMLIDLARAQRSLSKTMAAIQGRPAALLMVEFSSDSEAEVADNIAKLASKLQRSPGLIATVTAIDPALRDPLWNLRSAALPLLYGMFGNRKPVTFVEDCAVDPAVLPAFTARFQKIIHDHGTTGAFYGHASVGCLHIRPVLNLHDPNDIVTMRSITEQVTDLVLEFGGSLSGEHGDGLSRSEWNLKMFGPQIYEAFKQVKRLFDPRNLFNPGKIVDAPAMDANFRMAPGEKIPQPATVFNYDKQGGFFASIEMCNGVGVCRKTQGGAMCPSYRATMDEKDTTRARANAMRVSLLTTDANVGARWVAPVMDLCLSCKACKTECPSNVDVAKLKAEFQQSYYAHRPRPLGHYIAKNIHRFNPMGARVAGLANWLGRQSFAKAMMESLCGIDRRRTLPEFHRNHLRRWFRRRKPTQQTKRVVLLDDCFTSYQEPKIGQAAVELLERSGYEVKLARVCCGRAMISKGFLTTAKQLVIDSLPRLMPFIEEGLPILGLEPSCILTLADEWTELVPGDKTARIAANVHLVESWFLNQVKEGLIDYQPVSTPANIVYHPHCHQRSLVGVKESTEALQLSCSGKVNTLDAGCCGMAGMFGYEKEHYDISVKIANTQLIPAIAREPDSTVVASGTSCRHQIRDLTGKHPLHPVEILANSLTGVVDARS